MLSVMSKTRITYTVEERYRRAFESHAATVGLTTTEFFHKLVEENCSDALERVDKAMLVEESMKQPDRRKKHF